MAATVVHSHFSVLTDAEQFIDRQVERYLELHEDGLPGLFSMTHDIDAKTFRLVFNEPNWADHEATYAVDNLHEFGEED